MVVRDQSGFSGHRLMRGGVKVWLLAGFAFTVVLFGLAWYGGAHVRGQLLAKTPPPGKLVDVGGYRLHLDCQGEGPVTVVFEAGLNEFSVQWAAIQSALATVTRACRYDRAGLGWSEPSPHPRTAAEMVTELHNLLQKAGESAPRLLVGHSYGGALVRLYAHRYPHEVSGLVLVDAAHEDQLNRIPAMIPSIDQMVGQFRELDSLNRWNILAWSPDEIPARGLDGRALGQYRALLASTAYFATAAAETQAFLGNLDEIRAANPHVSDSMRLAVISRGQPDPLPGMDAEEAQRYEAAWRRLQLELASLAPHASHLIAERSGHYIHLSEPELVVTAIRRLLPDAPP